MWARLDDAILDNPKIIAAGASGFLLHVAAITWCARNLTDGLIPKRRVRTLISLEDLGSVPGGVPGGQTRGHDRDTSGRFVPLDADAIAAELAALGLWHDRGTCWELHDYLVYNPSRAKVLADRERARSKKAKQRVSPDVSPGESLGDMNGCPLGSPDAVPMHPVPVPVPVPVPKKILSLSREDAPTRRPQRHPLPDSFALTPARRQYAEVGGVNADFEFAKFRDHARATSTRYADWEAAWRNWVRKVDDFAPRRGRGS